MESIDISSTDSESSDWDLEDYKAYNKNDSSIKDSATSVPKELNALNDWELKWYKDFISTSSPISESSSGTSSSGYRLCVSSFFPERKAPTKDVTKDNHHGSRVVFPSVKPPISIPTEQHGGTFFDICQPLGGFNKQAVSDARLVDEVVLPGCNQPVTEPNLPEGLISALLGLKNPRFVTSVEMKKSPFQTEAVRQLTGSLTKVEGLRFAIVVARFNEIVSKLLLEGALDTFKKYSVREEDIVVVWVPGSFEIGLVAEKLGKSGKYHAVLCIGAVVRGDTTDYDVVANSAASGILSAGFNSGVPCIFGVLTCDDMDKALSHAGGKAGNKGSEAALTAIEMASLFEHHLKE